MDNPSGNPTPSTPYLTLPSASHSKRKESYNHVCSRQQPNGQEFTEYPEQRHAGAVGLGPEYGRGPVRIATPS